MESAKKLKVEEQKEGVLEDEGEEGGSDEEDFEEEKLADSAGAAEETAPAEDPLLLELAQTAQGKDYIGSVSHVEILFTRIPSLAALSRVYNLIELCLIETHTETLVGIEALAHSLEVVRVHSCRLTTIEDVFLKMHNLREISLAENKLTRLQNLEGCRLLRTLWLYDNEIAKIEGLD